MGTTCRHFRGDLPCRFRKDCRGCPDEDPVGLRVLIIKLRALGDVLRTTPLLRRLRQEVKGAHVSWVTDGSASELLDRNPFLDRVLPWSLETVMRLEVENFDWIISLDKAPEAAALATKLRAQRKSGFGLDDMGRLTPFDQMSDYAYRLGIDDELKFKVNGKTYQEITFEQLGWDFRGEEYVWESSPDAIQWARKRLVELGIASGRSAVGLAVGAGKTFANKTWPPSKWAALARSIRKDFRREVLLLVGPQETDLGREVSREAALPGIVASGGDHDIDRFAAIIGQCEAMVSGDTLAMHLGVALKTPVVALFGPTCAQEVELYGRGFKLVSPKVCSPCYRVSCSENPTCLEEIEEKKVLEALGALLGS